MDDYDLPDAERIVAKILSGIVREDQIGPLRVDVYQRYHQRLAEQGEDPTINIEDFDFISIARRQGYLDDAGITDITGIEIDVWAKTRSRALRIMHEVTKRMRAAELTSVDGFEIDLVETLNGPEFDTSVVMDERNINQSFTVEIRVRWK